MWCCVVVPRRGILVVKDSEHRTTGVCGLLGTNVLSHVPAMSDALRSMATSKDSPRDMTRVARVAGGRSIFVPSHSTMDIPARGDCMSGTAIVEPLCTATPGNIVTLNTLVASDVFVVKVLNNSPTSVSLNPGMKIGLLRSVTVCHSATVDVTGEEITLCVGNGEEEPAEPVVDVLAGLDLSELEDSPAALAKARAMFHRQANVFASSEYDLGCTDAIKHRINTTDARPVAQPYW